MKEAMLYKQLGSGRIRCDLCEHRCVIADGEKGICGVRQNSGGELYTLVYGSAIARHVDPVEKKPLFHFHPGSRAYSIATPGCNFKCRWCQNWQISQMAGQERFMAGEKYSPRQIVEDAVRQQCRSIAYTYTEPTVFFEYAYDTARIARRAGLANFFISNGFMTEAMLEKIHPYLDAVNIDLKAFSDQTYRRYVGARIDPVLRNLKIIKEMGIWLEVTTLLIPGINDQPEEVAAAAGFIARDLGVDTPWHISRFFPAFEMNDVPATPNATLERAAEIGRRAGLRYMYLGNTGSGENTSCHKCGATLIERSGYRIVENRVAAGGCCPDCAAPVSGVGMFDGDV